MSAVRKPTLAGKISRAREIIDGYALGAPFNATHLSELADLSGTELRAATRHSNPMFPADPRHLHVVAYDWIEPQQWSWRSAIEDAHKKDPVEALRQRQHQKRMFALRHAVRMDLRDFRMAISDPACASCGAIDDLTTDHISPAFIQIAMQFLDRHQHFELRKVRGCGDLIACMDLEAEWVAFHASLASYQLLCRGCNSRKGAQ